MGPGKSTLQPSLPTLPWGNHTDPRPYHIMIRIPAILLSYVFITLLTKSFRTVLLKLHWAYDTQRILLKYRLRFVRSGVRFCICSKFHKMYYGTVIKSQVVGLEIKTGSLSIISQRLHRKLPLFVCLFIYFQCWGQFQSLAHAKKELHIT